jgi:diguanylate cyclase (GGDEF)-like protein/PAS domain S-box-containing protein
VAKESRRQEGRERDGADVEERGEAHRQQVQAMAAAMDGMAVLDPTGRYAFLNEAHARMYGYDSPTELMGRSWRLLYTGDELRRFETEVMPAFWRTGRWRGESTGVRRDGTSFPQEISLDAIQGGGIVCVVRDISDRKRSERLQSALYRIAETTTSVEDMDALLAAIHSIVSELMYARNFYIALYDEPSRTLRFPYFVDEIDTFSPQVPAGRGLTEYVLRTGEPLLASPAVFAELVTHGHVELVGEPSLDWLGVPLKRGDKAFGVLVVQSYTEDARFTEDDLELLTFVSRHIATAMDRKAAADALQESEGRFRALADTAPCAIFIYQGSAFRYANEATASITGYSRTELAGMEFWQMVHPEIRDEARERGLARQKGEALPSRYEIKILRKDGEVRWLDYSAGLLEFDGKPAVLGTAFDITERKRAEEQIKSLAYHDILTGLPNRLLFADRLAMAVAQAHRQGQKLGVLFLDIDRFKVINDSLGHTLGDRLLQAVAERIEGGIREGDTVARLGGDEFTLLLPGIARGEDAAKVAEKILETLRQPLPVDGREFFVTGSVGISLYPDDGLDPETLVKNADAAMYRAKDKGRDTYQLYAAAMNDTAVERLALENSLRTVLARNELVLYYQPLMNLATGRAYGVEALLRWNRPGKGLVFPDDFIPLAEVTGLIIPIGPWVWRTACEQVRRWQESGLPDLRLAVNLSARQFQQPDVAAQVTRALRETGFPPSLLDLEITESYAMQNPEAAIQTLRELKALGVGLSIDDFGVGHSSLSYLKRLPIDTLKIDRSFIRDITVDSDAAAIVTAVIAMARTLKLQVVAEGVETEPQRAFLAEQGCDRAQGWLYSRAVPAEECGRLLR